MKTKILFLLVFVAMCWTTAMAQLTVKGTVVSDSESEPLVGVAILEKGTGNGTITDIDGNYSIQLKNNNATLVVSYVGYTTQNISVNGRSKIDIRLVDDSKLLDDVVVVGYGVMKKSDLAGSVASVDREAMMKRAPVNIGQALQGAAAGVMVTAQDGAPDAKSAIRIRGIGTINGSADPLYVVDGVKVGTNANFLNPQDIESIEVLKDASATAIYGSEGANGVIMVTTKHGQKGHSEITVTADFGIQTLPYKIETLGIDQFAAVVRETKKNQGEGLYNNVWAEQYDGKRNYIDWQDEMTRSALRHQYGLSATGGNDKSQYNFSVGYLNYDGLVINTNANRLNFRGNVKTQVNKYLEFGGDLAYIHSESHGSNAGFNNNGNLSSLRDFAYMTPTLDYVQDNIAGGKLVNVNLVNPNGTYGTGYMKTSDGWEGNTSNAGNPYASQMEQQGRSRSNQVIASSYLQLTLMKGLTAKSVASYSYYGGDSYSHAGGRERYNIIDGQYVNIPYDTNGADNRYEFGTNNSSSYTLAVETFLTYNYKDKHNNLTVMAGNTVSKSFGQWTSASAKDFFSANNMSTALTKDPTTKAGNGAFNADTRMISYFGRAMYSLNDRYILTATIRRDGSSNFGPGNRWGTFPSAAIAWRISEEEFMKDIDFISNLKLRAGWGQTGNAGGMAGMSTAALKSDATKYKFYQQGATIGNFGGNDNMTTGLYGNFVDTNLKWETNEQTNIGIDLGILAGDLNITVDWFKRNSKDLLLWQQMRSSTGFSSVYTNYGEIQNTGFEFSATYNKQLNNDWSINVSFNGSTLKNEVKKMGSPLYSQNDGSTGDGSNVGAVGAPAGFHWGNHSICTEGEAVGSFYGYKTDGIIMNESQLNEYLSRVSLSEGEAHVGDFMFKDLNNDKVLDQNDMTILGNGIPKFNYGITIGASYKNWDFNIYGYGVLGQDILSYSAMRLSTVFSADDQTFPNILKSSYDKIAHVENGVVTNANATLPRLMMVDKALNMRCSDAWVKNGNFFRMSNIQVGYTFPKNWISPLGLQAARLSFAVQNLFTASPYKKYGDPEVGQGSVLFSGLDTGRFPMPRTYQFGVNVTF